MTDASPPPPRPSLERLLGRIIALGLVVLVVLVVATRVPWSELGPDDDVPEEATVPETTTPPPPAPEPEPPTTGLEVRLVFEAASWLEVRVDDVQIEPGRVAAVEEDLTFEGEERVVVRLGNAGGVQLAVDGGEPAPAGADGEVLTLEFGPDGLVERTE